MIINRILKTLLVKAYQVDIKGAPPTFTETAWPLSWPQPTYDSSTGLLTVTMDMSFTDFQNGYTAAKEEDCQPASFCTLNSSNSSFQFGRRSDSSGASTADAP